jgi:4-diphosphocytidyl-2-C-methyl-D-erythritol kinase
VAAPGSDGRGAALAPSAAVELEAPAKVNLYLQVFEPGADGYHPIVTLFQALELSDRLRVRVVPGSEVSLVVTGLDAGPAEDNLARRAAQAFLEAAGARAGVRIDLEKRIPAGGGLGGGSSDAAATLRALDALLPGALPAGRLQGLAARLGSDVPFFLCGSPLARGEGRGEKLTPLAPLPAADLILALPESPVSTAWAYRALDAHRAAVGVGGPLRAPSPARPTSWDGVAREARNDFEVVVPASHPLVARAREALLATGPQLALLAGSGSSSFAVYASSAAARRALELLPHIAGVRFLLTRTRTALPEVATMGAHTRSRG